MKGTNTNAYKLAKNIRPWKTTLFTVTKKTLRKEMILLFEVSFSKSKKSAIVNNFILFTELSILHN